MNEIELLKYQLKTQEKQLLAILKDINNRLNKLEDDIKFIRENTASGYNYERI